MKKPVIIFDFCDTLVSLQTADYFCKFVIKGKNNTRINCIEIVRNILHKLHLIMGTRNKAMHVKKLKNITQDELDYFSEKFFNEVLNKNKINQTNILLQNHIKRGDKIIISSAGFSSYISKYINNITNSKEVIISATNLESKNGKLTGKIKNNDNIGEEKVKRLKETINFKQVDWENSVVYSDSLSDRPLFNLVGRKVYITNKSDQEIQDIISKVGVNYFTKIIKI